MSKLALNVCVSCFVWMATPVPTCAQGTVSGIVAAVAGRQTANEPQASTSRTTDNRPRGESKDSQKGKGSYNDRIASADAVVPVTMDGPSILIRSVDGADGRSLDLSSLTAGTANLKYSLLDNRLASARKIAPDYLLDIVVRPVSRDDRSGGGTFWRNIKNVPLSVTGNVAKGSGTFQVSLSLVDFVTAKRDPSRTATMTVKWTLYQNRNGYFTVSSVSGYGNHNHYTSDPRTAAAEEALNHFFGLQK